MAAVKSIKNVAGNEASTFLKSLAKRKYSVLGLTKIIEDNNCILTEASVIEKLRRSEGIQLNPRLENATLLYDDAGKRAMRDVYRAYIDVARDDDLSMNISSPTWRANCERSLETTSGKDI